MRLLPVLLPAIVLFGVAGLVARVTRVEINTRTAPAASATSSDLASTVSPAERAMAVERGIAAPAPADDLQVLRRLSLALHGTIPSLEEIRRFESDSGSDRLERWTDAMLRDRRFADYFAERLARSYVGTEVGQVIVYRRGRFVSWLSDQLYRSRPYDEIAREIISERGLWTGQPAANFVTAAAVDSEIDENILAGRTVRAFLGQRIDCAQCHDHPFAHWKQAEFEGLAAFYGQTKLSVAGVDDDRKKAFLISDMGQERKVDPAVPFEADWLPADTNGFGRERLAAWVTHPENVRFERAAANRVWGLLFGRAWTEPVDDLPDPVAADEDLLDVLGADFRAHGYDLRRLIRVIAATPSFRGASTIDEGQESHGGSFPLTRLRPEQMIGSMLQAASIKTIDQNSHLLTRTIRFFRERDFVEEYGDAGVDELEPGTGTIPQALLRMNGKLSQEITKSNPFNSTGRIAMMSPDDKSCLELCYLVSLTRRPTVAEQEHFLPQLAGKDDEDRQQAVEDILWALFNSAEFAWNH